MEENIEKPKRKRNFWPLLVFIGCLAGLLFALSKLFFPIWGVYISGSEHLKSKEIMQITKISLGEPWFWLSVPKNITKNSWIKDFKITKKFPGQIFIDIIERKPVATFSKDGKEQVIADDGTILTNAPKPNLVITGFGPKRFQESIEITKILKEILPSRIEFSPQGFLIVSPNATIWANSIASLRKYAYGVTMLARMGSETNFSRLYVYDWGVSLTP